MAGKSVRSSGGYLKVTSPISMASGQAYSIVGAFQLVGTIGSGFTIMGPHTYDGINDTHFQMYRYSSGAGGNANKLFVSYRDSGAGGHDIEIPGSTTLIGSWIHYAWCVDTSNNANFYCLVEGFNASSPSYL